MAGWLDRFRQSISGERSVSTEVRHQLSVAQRRRARIDLIELTGDPYEVRLQDVDVDDDDDDAEGTGIVMATTIEQFETNSMIVSQPYVGGVPRTIPTNRWLRLTIHLGRTRLCGFARNLGRAKVRSGGRTMLYGYRLTMPTELDEPDDRRQSFRLPVGIDLAPTADMAIGEGMASEFQGKVVNVSVDGVLIAVRASSGDFPLGSDAVLRMSFPEPAGDIEVTAEIRHVSKRGEVVSVGFRFRQPVPGLEEFIRASEIRRLQRRRSA